MHVTRAAEYAIRGMLYVASQNGRRRVLVSEIASAEDLSPSFLAKIFQQLRKAGLVVSHRGTRGGFRLRVRPRHIQLRQIIEAAQGSLDEDACCSSSASCPRLAEACPLAGIWNKINGYTAQTLEGTSLADILPPKRSRSQ